MSTGPPDGAVCMPNLSPGGRRLRSRVSRISAAIAMVALGATIALGAAWWVRGVAVFLPALIAGLAFLEARSSVCVVGAVHGTFESDDRSKTPVGASHLPAIRRVAVSIGGKSTVIALVTAIAASLTALARF